MNIWWINNIKCTKMHLHPGKERGNTVTSGETKRQCSYIRGEKREIQLHPGREKGNTVKSGERKGNAVHCRERKGKCKKREGKGKKRGNAVASRERKGKCGYSLTDRLMDKVT